MKYQACHEEGTKKNNRKHFPHTRKNNRSNHNTNRQHSQRCRLGLEPDALGDAAVKSALIPKAPVIISYQWFFFPHPEQVWYV